MVAVFFMIYAAIGAGAGWSLFTYAGIELNLAIVAGAIITALIGQVHLFATRSGDSSDLKTRIDTVEAAEKDVRDRIDTVEARATAIETTVKQELTERRDALADFVGLVLLTAAVARKNKRPGCASDRRHGAPKFGADNPHRCRTDTGRDLHGKQRDPSHPLLGVVA